MSPPVDDPMAASRRGPNVPFDAIFFKTILPDRIQTTCPGQGAQVPVVLLTLADGRQLDLCHIELLTPSWMAVAAFREKPSCEDMDSVFVPYEMVSLVTISTRSPSQRSVGFQIEKQPKWRSDMGPETSSKEEHACKPAARSGPI